MLPIGHNYWDQLYHVGKHYRVKVVERLGLNSEKWKRVDIYLAEEEETVKSKKVY